MALFLEGVQAETAEEWDKIGDVLDSMDRHLEAAGAYDKANQLDPGNVKLSNKREKALMSLGRYEVDGWVVNDMVGPNYATLMTYEKAIQSDPDNAKAWYNKASVLSRMGRYKNSLDSIDKAIQIDPEFSDAWWYKGGVLKKMGRIKEADEAFSKAKALKA